MTMDNLMMLALEAHSDEGNHHRRYELMIGCDLFGDWTLAIRYGRVGTVGQQRCYASVDPAEIRRIIRNCLARRSSALKRIGCAYRLVDFDSAIGFEAARWLHAEICFESVRIGVISCEKIEQDKLG